MRKTKEERYAKKNLDEPLSDDKLRKLIILLNKEREEKLPLSGEIYKFRENYYFIKNKHAREKN